MAEMQHLSTFGDFRFDRARLRLTRRDRPVAITGLPLRILEILLASGGRVVTRAEFKQLLWPYAIQIDTGRRLNTAIRALREALGDSGGAPRFIETLRGRGYRWIAGEAPVAVRDSRWRLAPLLFALLLLVGGSSAHPASAPTAEQRARLVRLAAAEGPAALAGVERLILERPGFADAHLVRARMAMEQWRSRGGELHLVAASAAVGDAAAAIGESPLLDSLAAELALTGSWDWTGAERLYRSALGADPDNVSALRGLAWLYVNSGRPERAWTEISRLLSLSPLTGESRADLGWLLLRMNRPELASSVCADGAAPINLLACRHTALAATGDMESAKAAALELMERAAADPGALAAIRRAPPAEAYRHFLSWRAADFLPRGSSWFQQAQVQAAAGRYRTALDCLDRARAERDPLLVKLASTPEFRPLRRSRRFRAMLETLFDRA